MVSDRERQGTADDLFSRICNELPELSGSSRARKQVSKSARKPVKPAALMSCSHESITEKKIDGAVLAATG
jgi:hypothetical protein